MHNSLQQTFEQTIERFNASPGMQRFWQGELSKIHYGALMREIFHHSRENPQIQATATAYFRGEQRQMVQPFLRHALSEIGHDQLALSDAKACGIDTQNIESELPLPATTALVAFAYYQIFNLNPVGYLGYLYYLEFMPTTFGADYLQGLVGMGVGAEATSFIQDHATIDVGHNKLMHGYIDALVRTEEELESARYAIEVTGYLYGCMVEEAFASVDAFATDLKVAAR